MCTSSWNIQQFDVLHTECICVSLKANSDHFAKRHSSVGLCNGDKGKGKAKVHPRTGHEGPEGE